MRQTYFAPVAVLFALATAACGGDTADSQGTDQAADQPMEQAAAPASPTVAIVEPAEGAVVDGPNVTVTLTAEGVEIVPAGELVPGTGHHHLYLDADLAPAGVPVPTVPGQIIHMGTGVSEYTFENVAPGPHRLIAVVADGIHMPLQPWVVDTVTFTVR